MALIKNSANSVLTSTSSNQKDKKCNKIRKYDQKKNKKKRIPLILKIIVFEMFIIFIGGLVSYDTLLNIYSNNVRVLEKQHRKEKWVYQTKNDVYGSVEYLKLKEEMLQTKEKNIMLLEERIKLKNDMRDHYDEKKTKNDNRATKKEDASFSSITTSKDEHNMLLKKYSIIKEENDKLKKEGEDSNKINKKLHEEHLILRSNFEVFKKEYQHRLRALNKQKEENMKDKKYEESDKKYKNLYEEHSILGANLKSLKKELQLLKASRKQKDNLYNAEIETYKNKYADLNNRFVSLQDKTKGCCTNASPDDEKSSCNSDSNNNNDYKHQYEDLSSDYLVLKDENDELKKNAEYEKKNSNGENYQKAYSDVLIEYLILQDSFIDRAIRKRPQLYGGHGGEEFDDGFHKNILKINVKSGQVVDSINIVYAEDDGSTTECSHGGGVGADNELTLREDEYIVRIIVKSNIIGVQNLTFRTNLGRVLGPSGGKDGLLMGFWNLFDWHQVDSPGDGFGLIGIKGRKGKCLDAIGFHWGMMK